MSPVEPCAQARVSRFAQACVTRFTRACVTAAARRWPDDLAQTMCREWHAELDALRADTALGSLTRSRRALAFAASLALSRTVEAADAEPRTRRDHVARLGPALAALSVVVGVPVLAAALFNVVHDANHGLAALVTPAARTMADVGLVVAATGAMWSVGAAAAAGGRFRLIGRPATAGVTCTVAVAGTIAVGLAMYGFLLAGNRVAVMPFMGWIDLAPGVAAWAVLTAVAIGLAARAAAAGHRRIGWLAGAVGTLVALDATAVCGSLHAARTLDVGVGSAPAWFPLALLPGGAVHFGRFFADGAASFGGLRQSGPAFHASDILLGNASAMMGPLLLCSAFLLAYATHGAGRLAGTAPAAARPPRRSGVVRMAAAGVVVAAAVATWAYVVAHTFDPIATLARIEDNSAVFGFGFAAHPAGRIALALLIGVFATRFAVTARAAAEPSTHDGDGRTG
jgi:hypothetical protein